MMKRHGMKSNPAAELHSAKADKPLPVYVRQSEMASMLAEDFDTDEFTSVRDRLILLMFYSTGMRSSELETLLDNDVNTAKGELKVMGKRNKERIIPFGEELSEMIAKYRNLRDTTVGRPPHGTLLRQARRTALVPKAYLQGRTRSFEGRTVAARQSPHVLRHSFASDMLNNGADLFSVQQLLGHKSLETTQVYTHITYQELKTITNWYIRVPQRKEDPMEINIKSIHFDATEQLQSFIEKKLNKLARRFESITKADVTLKVVKPETSMNKEAAVKLTIPMQEEFYASKIADTFRGGCRPLARSNRTPATAYQIAERLLIVFTSLHALSRCQAPLKNRRRILSDAAPPL